MGACFSRLKHQPGDGVVRHVAIDQRRGKGAVGIGAHQSGQRDPAGAPQRNHRHQADQARRSVWRRRCIGPGAERGYAGAAACEGVDRQFPVGQIIAVRLDGAFGKPAPLARGDVAERREPIAIGRSCSRLRAPTDAILQQCAADHR